MLMFSTFEHTVDFLYKNVLGTQKSDCSKGVQLGVTCIAGYMSGVTGTFISNPSSLLSTRVKESQCCRFDLNLADLIERY